MFDLYSDTIRVKRTLDISRSPAFTNEELDPQIREMSYLGYYSCLVADLHQESGSLDLLSSFSFSINPYFSIILYNDI